MVTRVARLYSYKDHEQCRKKKVPRDKRRGQQEYQEFEQLYSTLREKGLELADAKSAARAHG